MAINNIKICTKCREPKPLTEFWIDKGKPDGLRYLCKPCWREYQRKYGRAWGQRLKYKVLAHYSKGKPKCIHCGFDDIRALSVDHINGGGHQHLALLKVGSGRHFYHWLNKNNYPDGFQVLCMNCQFIKRNENHETTKLKEI